MNNFGFNPMGINPMFMNNIGMNNNQQNLMNNNIIMDENSMRIKNIILPYERKIKELEDIIRQKDFEIAILTDKLNNNGTNMQNQKFMNMNQMMQNLSNNDFNYGKEIVVSFVTPVYTRQFNCFEYDMTYKLLDKIAPNYNWKFLKYTNDGKKIHPFLSIRENGIKYGAIIKCNRVININFRGDYGSKLIAMDENCPIKKAIKFYLLRIGKENCFNQFYFLYNLQKLKCEDETPIKNIFADCNPTVRVNSL